MKCCGQDIIRSRVNKDTSFRITLTKQIYPDGTKEPIDFDDYKVKDVIVVHDGITDRLSISNVVWLGDTLSFDIPGQAQKTGTYRVIITCDSGAWTWDSLLIEYVDYTCEESYPVDSDIVIGTVQIDGLVVLTSTGKGLRAVVAGDGISVSEISEGAQTIAVKLDTVSSDNVLQITEHGLYVPTPKWKQFE